MPIRKRRLFNSRRQANRGRETLIHLSSLPIGIRQIGDKILSFERQKVMMGSPSPTALDTVVRKSWNHLQPLLDFYWIKNMNF